MVWDKHPNVKLLIIIIHIYPFWMQQGKGHRKRHSYVSMLGCLDVVLKGGLVPPCPHVRPVSPHALLKWSSCRRSPCWRIPGSPTRRAAADEFPHRFSSLSSLFSEYAARAGKGNVFAKHEHFAKHLVWTWIYNWLYVYFVQTFHIVDYQGVSFWSLFLLSIDFSFVNK